MSSPKGRTTRSNSSSNSTISLQDIHNLINATRNELVLTMKDETDKINKMLAGLSEKVVGLEARLDAFDARQRNQEIEIDAVKESLKNINITDNKIFFDDICTETTERWRKRKYLIVSGIPEHSLGNVEERREKDKDALEHLAKEMGVEDLDLDSEEVSRVGRLDSNRPRLLRFRCEDAGTRRQLLRNSKDLRKSSSFQSVYINPDLTHFQRTRNAELRNEVRRRRNDGKNVGIRRGRIVDLTQTPNFQ